MLNAATAQYERIEERDNLRLFLVFLAGLTLARLVAQQFSVVDMDVDEAQYWGWSRELALGYFSKPPLIAWINAASGFLCGTSTACVRAPAPLFYFGTSLLVYGIAREFYSSTAALWAGITSALALGISFSSRIMTTDVPLLFFWALALLAYVKLLRGGGWWWSLALALGFGFGLLAKYAMAYFLAGVLLAALLDRRAARLTADPRLWLALLGGLAMLLPNVAWNFANSFATLGATAHYVGGSALHFRPGNALSFLLAQFAVAGPVTFATLLILYVRLFRPGLAGDDRILLAFTIPPLVLVTANGFFGSANANWAAPAFVAAFVVTAAVLVRENRRGALMFALVFGLVCQVFLFLGDAFADRITIPGLARGDLYRRVLGWSALGDKVGELANESGAASVAVLGRGETATLIYYRRNDPRPIYIFPPPRNAGNQFEMTRPLMAGAPEPILAVTPCSDPALFAKDYADVAALGPFDIASGPTSLRRYFAFRLSGNRGTVPVNGNCG